MNNYLLDKQVKLPPFTLSSDTLEANLAFYQDDFPNGWRDGQQIIDELKGIYDLEIVQDIDCFRPILSCLSKHEQSFVEVPSNIVYLVSNNEKSRKLYQRDPFNSSPSFQDKDYILLVFDEQTRKGYSTNRELLLYVDCINGITHPEDLKERLYYAITLNSVNVYKELDRLEDLLTLIENAVSVRIKIIRCHRFPFHTKTIDKQRESIV